MFNYNIQTLNVHIRPHLRNMAIGLLFLSCLPISVLQAEQAAKVAGQVTLVIGDVKVSRASQELKPLALHDTLYVGDLIESADSGHVQIRFIDNGIISLRPNSRLQIDQYDVDSQQTKKSAIRLNLQKGVLRSISGEATEAAHERFRLNTPITAIGVLGTDFLVKANNDKVLAAVYSGAIAIAPFNATGCNAQGLGPCQGAFQLGASSNTIIFEQQQGEIHHKLLENSKQVIGSKSDNTLDPSLQTVAVDSGNYLFKDAEAIMQRLKVEPVNPSEVSESPFAWARWDGDQIPGDMMTKAFNVARQGKQPVDYNDHFVLFRTPVANTDQFPAQGRYNFTMSQGQVVFQYKALPLQNNVTVAGELISATMNINFASKEFTSHFEMQVPNAIPKTSLDIQGVVSGNGFLVGGSATNGVSGALNKDASAAALMFEKTVSQGVFQGVTNWVRP